MILAINTSTPQYSIALVEEDGALLSEYFMCPGSRSFGHFMPSIDFLLKASKPRNAEIGALIVATGPGSFTGLRVGLSGAKGMAQGLQVPIIGVSSLEAMASQVPYSTYPVCPVIDSRKGEIFAALFIWRDDRTMARTLQDTCLKIVDLPSIIGEKTLFLGNDFSNQAGPIKRVLSHRALFAPPHIWGLKASAVGNLGLKRFQSHDFDDLQDLVPTYLRPPDIRPNPFASQSEVPRAEYSAGGENKDIDKGNR